MNELKTRAALLILCSALISACNDRSETVETTTAGTDETASKQLVMPQTPDGASPGKPSAPISMRYEIMNNPIVGMPVQINVEINSNEGPVKVEYSITDSSAILFQEGQVRRLEIRDPTERTPRQLSVIPQREGRLYVNVSAEVETPGGPMIRSMSIPVKVGAAREEATINGELVEGPDGEAVISLPAQETN